MLDKSQETEKKTRSGHYKVSKYLDKQKGKR